MFLSAEELKGYVDGIIHEETQFADKGLDLTVDRVLKARSPTELDFGGSEEKRGELETLEPKKRSPEDDYGWWNLEGGIYIITFNEDIEITDGLGLIAPLERLTVGGSFHSTFLLKDGSGVRPILFVNSSGLNIKENARTSRLHIWR
ncbi:dCTP deaminase [Candidatus Bipolaricaulota bacterium]|nr:dCTP deaminase [Candidatus Bipolaricaulota bacterium]